MIENTKYSHVMVDIETLSLEPNACLLSVGACVMFSADHDESFYARLDMDLQPEAFFHRSPDTVRWWATQSMIARDEAFNGKGAIHEVMLNLHTWIKNITAVTGKEIRIWSNHVDFDIPVLEHAFAYTHVDVPWKYDQILDYATMKAIFAKALGVESKFAGEKHTALADAFHQADFLEQLVGKLQDSTGINLGL